MERLDVLEGLLGRAPDMGKDGVDDTLGAWAVHELRTVCPEEPHPANFVRTMLTSYSSSHFGRTDQKQQRSQVRRRRQTMCARKFDWHSGVET